MKTILHTCLLTSALLIGMTAGACPDLTGTWSCKDTDNNTNTMNITQEVSSGHTVYHIENSAFSGTTEVITDGAPRAYSAGPVSGSVTSSCTNGSTLRMFTEGKETSGQYAFHTTAVVTKKSSHLFETSVDGVFAVPGQAPQSIKSLATCHK